MSKIPGGKGQEPERHTNPDSWLSDLLYFSAPSILPGNLEWTDGFMHACLAHAWAIMSKYQLLCSSQAELHTN